MLQTRFYYIGCCISLPDYIKSKHSIIGLESKDYLCFWRCLALFKYDLKPSRATAKAKELFKEYYDNNKKFKEYRGLSLAEIISVENYFKININIYINLQIKNHKYFN